mmetsp:Transcript_19109/g.29012  ORF Transcript_19109/g.29012 Transcript_19109/m.29012 type:complete len:778 (-) Transcript_19109:392-2725(-)
MACNLPTGGIPSTVNPDLIQERAKATFDPSAITAFFDGDASRQRTKTARRRQLESLIANDPSGVFDNDTNNYMHRTERHVRSLAKHVRLIELCRSLGFGDPAKHGNNGNSSVNDVNDSVSPGEVLLDSEWYDISAALADDLPTALHWVMFLPNIISLCDEEQQKRFLPLCRDWRMIGCYAQTEVGHGSNVRALETTATFLKEGEHCPTTGQVAPISIGGGGGGGGAWIINSPTLTSTKFWPGTLGRTCNHAMVIARLIDAAGVDHGVHNFLVQTRSMEDHSLMPGVTCGDIGPKIGYNVMDNGFAKFEHVLIPRRNMAMRFAVVDEDGVYSKKTVSDAASKVAYITMMQVRSYIILEASKALRLGTTMVIRYSAVRKQGFTHNNGNGGDGDGDSSKEENQILDYMQQQHRLFPLLASSYCIFFTGKKMLADLKAIEDRLVKLVESDGTDTGGEGEGEGETAAAAAAIKDEGNVGGEDERPAKKARTEKETEQSIGSSATITAAAAATVTATATATATSTATATTTRGTVVVSKGSVVASSAPTSTSASASASASATSIGAGIGVGSSDRNGVYQITVPDKALPQGGQSNTTSGQSQGRIPPPPPPPPPRPGMHGYGGAYNGYNNAGGASAVNVNAAAAAAAAPKKPAVRMAAGKTWTDETLSDFPANDFRLFVGNLAKELDEEAVGEAFRSKYDSFVMARVIYNKISGESKGYGFVSVMDPKDCAKAIREMDGSWLGNRPIKVKLSDWKERDLREVRKSKGKKGKGGRGSRGRGRRR